MIARLVYFIRPLGMDGPVKIGCSADLSGRLRASACWSPFELEVIATVPGGYDLEHRFHAMFEADHLRLEWFSWSDRMAVIVEAINSGSFDPEILPAPKYVGLSKVMRKWHEGRAEASA